MNFCIWILLSTSIYMAVYLSVCLCRQKRTNSAVRLSGLWSERRWNPSAASPTFVATFPQEVLAYSWRIDGESKN